MKEHGNRKYDTVARMAVSDQIYTLEEEEWMRFCEAYKKEKKVRFLGYVEYLILAKRFLEKESKG